ncbi:MAG: hypothetical protein IJM42_05750, partial [Synergistes sp.]|nr:hypothetical protein [Synergistes sp.]
MTWIRKRIIAGLTALLMLIVLLPTWALADDDRKIDDGDVWTAIGELEQAGIEEAAHLMEDGTDPAKNPEYYASLSEQVEALVTARADYEPGSVIRRGAFFFWKDTSGVVYGYSPDLRAQLNGGREQEDTEALEDASALDAKIAALEEAQAARTKSASEEVVLMGGTTTDPDVAVFSPYYPNYDERFTKSVYYRGLQIAQATGGKCTFYYGTDVTIDKIAKALTENGVIFFDTHGSTDNTLFELVAAPGNTAYLTLTNRTGIDWEKDGAKVTAPNGDEYYHVFIFGWEKCCIDGAVIVNHVKGEVVTGLFGLNCCMGMKNDGLCRPLREAGVEVVYGYSQPVTFTTNNLHLRFLAEALTRGMDGAGIARYMKEQTCQYVLENLNLNDYTRENLTSLGSICWDPYHYNLSEERARENMDAFLLFCSPEDPYPAEGHRDQPQTVRSTWRLSLAGGGTDSGNIHISCETGQEIEQFFPNAVKTELIGGSLPGTLEIKTKTYGGEDIPALCGNVGDVPGYYEAFFNVTFKGGAKGNRRAEILVIDRTNDQTTEETLLAEAGTEQTLTFDYWDTADNFGYRKIDGEIPPGMEIVYDKETGLSFQGKPIIPGWYASLWRIV